MITLNQKQFEKVAKLIAINARLDELNRLEGYVPSAAISRRKSILRKQVSELKGDKKEEEQTINIRIEVPAEEKQVTKKEKSYAVNLKNILGGKFNKVEDDDDETLIILRNLLPVEHQEVLGKIVREL